MLSSNFVHTYSLTLPQMLSRPSLVLLTGTIMVALAGGGVWFGTTLGDEKSSDEIATENTAQNSSQPESPPDPSQFIVNDEEEDEEDCAMANGGNGPWDNKLEITTLSADGTEMVGRPEVFVDRAGVVTMIQDADGRLVAAFQWFPCDDAESFDKVAVMISEDEGETWSDPELVEIEGLPKTYVRPFDPTLALTPEGKIRLYFTSSADANPVISPAFNIYSALSDDGINYTFEEGARFDLEVAVYDSAVAYWEGIWYLITPKNENGEPAGAYYGTSEDGLNFTRQADIDNYEDTGWTGNFLVIDDALRFYGVGTQTSGMGWTATEDGETWSVPEYFENFFGGDPAVVCLEDRCLVITTGMR